MERGRDIVVPAPSGGSPPGPGELDRSTHRRRWVVTFVLLVVFFSAWSLVTPPGGGPDESAHTIRAATLLDGQFTGDPYPAIGGGARLVEAPAPLDALDPVCFAFQPGISAECRPSYDGPDGDKEMVTNAGISPPAYYAFVGLPLRLFPSLEGVYLARLVSGVIAAALVATAVQLAVAARSRFLVAGVAVALTPIAAFLSGVINPSALEISAALLVWVSGLLIVRPVDLPPWLSRRLIWHFAVASCAVRRVPAALTALPRLHRGGAGGGRTVAAAARGGHRPADLGGRRRGHRRHAVRHVVLRRLPRG